MAVAPTYQQIGRVATLFPFISGKPCGDGMHVTCSEFPNTCLDWFGLTGLYWPFPRGWCHQTFAHVIPRHPSGPMLSCWQHVVDVDLYPAISANPNQSGEYTSNSRVPAFGLTGLYLSFLMWLVLITPHCRKPSTPCVAVDGGDHGVIMPVASLLPSITGKPCGDCMHVTCSEFPNP